MNPTSDLHLHTYFSDGLESPEEMVALAKSLGYSTVAITDHDGVSGLDAALKAGKKEGISVIPGVELSCFYDMPDPFGSAVPRYTMHILGYGINHHDKTLRRELDKIMELRRERNERMRLWFSAQGVEMSREELESHSPGGYVGKTTFARILVERGLCQSIGGAFKDPRYLGNPGYKAIEREKTDAGKAIQLIEGAGGRAFLAHPFKIHYTGWKMHSPQIYTEHLEMVIAALAGEGLAGIECYYSTHTKEQTVYLKQLADDLGLLASRGSDCHGRNIGPERQMTEFAAEPTPKTLAWIKAFKR